MEPTPDIVATFWKSKLNSRAQQSPCQHTINLAIVFSRFAKNAKFCTWQINKPRRLWADSIMIWSKGLEKTHMLIPLSSAGSLTFKIYPMEKVCTVYIIKKFCNFMVSTRYYLLNCLHNFPCFFFQNAVNSSLWI